MQDNEKSANKIVVTVINQNGDETYIKFNRNAKLKAVTRGYCDRKSVDVDSVAFLFGDCFLRTNQSPDELKMQDGDKIYAFHAESLRRKKRGGFFRGTKEGSHDQSEGETEEHADKDPSEKEIHENALAFVKLEKRNTRAFKQATLFLKASFDMSRRMTKNARKYMEEVQTKTKSLKGDLNANLSREHTLLAEELAEVKSNEERMSAVLDKVGNKRGVASGMSQSELSLSSDQNVEAELKRPRLHSPVIIKKTIPEEGKNHVDDSEQTVIRFLLDGESTSFRLGSSTMFGKLMRAYRDPDSLVSYQMSFIYDGRVIQKEQTPNELEMEDGEEIIVVLEAIPGELIIASEDPTPADRNWFYWVLCELC